MPHPRISSGLPKPCHRSTIQTQNKIFCAWRSIERDGYGKRFSMEQIERIAQCSKVGAAEAWHLGNSAPLINWLAHKLQTRSAPILPDLADLASLDLIFGMGSE